MSNILNRLAKWRSHFAGWQLGTRTKDDPESQAVRDHREVTLFLRCEASAVAALLIQKGVFTQTEYTAQLEVEAEHLERMLENRWPGAKATDVGMVYTVPACNEWMSKWRP